ncbi:hypothetical protein ACIOVF_19180 [Pseudomonas sp. NPDC087612]|uniref:hypothetical protein n=1 Tax=Pseudomonas sp. NPDC087612 TaxID=3364441 RepID=UPI0038130C57
MQITDLIGKKCRFVKESDKFPESYEPGRITVLLSEENRIVEIYRENDLPQI